MVRKYFDTMKNIDPLNFAYNCYKIFQMVHSMLTVIPIIQFPLIHLCEHELVGVTFSLDIQCTVCANEEGYCSEA